MDKRVFLLTVLFLLLSCDTLLESYLATGNSEGNGTIQGIFGRVVLEDNSPAEGAVVELMSAVRDSGQDSQTVVARDTADQAGYWVFPGLESGTYNLSVFFGTPQGDILGAFSSGLVFDSIIDMNTISLTRTGSVRTEILANAKPAPGAECAITGAPYSAAADQGGVCLLSGVPAGTYDIIYRYGSYVGRRDSIHVEAETQKDLGEATLLPDSSLPPPPPWDLISDYDRENGVVILSWQPVQVPDLKGYQLFRKDSSSKETIQLNDGKPIQDTVFMDTVFTDLKDTSSAIYTYLLVSEDSGGVQSASELFKPVTAVAPDKPSMAFPENGSRNVNPFSILSWTGIQPAEGKNVMYNVFLDTVPEAETPISRNQTERRLTLPNLRENTLYYWRVAAIRGDTTVMGPVWSFTTRPPPENRPPDIPTLTFPEDGLAGVNPSVELKWEGGDEDKGDSVSYKILVDTTNPPGALAAEHRETRVEMTKLGSGKTYFWQVIASDGKCEAASAVQSFTVNTAPEVPVLKKPENASSLSAGELELIWDGNDADGHGFAFEVYLGLDTAFDSAYGVTEEKSLKLTELEEGETYFWKVAARDSFSTSMSEAWSFRVNTPPSGPSLKSPANGARVLEETQELGWHGVDAEGDSLVYDVYLDTDSMFLGKGTTVSDSQLQVTGLEPGTVYYWKVAARDSLSVSTSEVWSFRVNTPPSAPLLQSPANGAWVLDETQVLAWSGGDGDGDSLVYDVYLGTDSTILVKEAAITDSWFKVTGLIPGTRYYWKVVALDGKSKIASSVARFTVKSKPDKPVLKGPSTGSCVSGYSQTLSWQGGSAQGDSLNYRIYLGLDSGFDTEYANTAETAIDVSNLWPHRTYFWKVVADNEAYQVASDVSSFKLVGRRIRMNTTESGTNMEESVHDFPVAVKLHGENFNFADAHPEGRDIRFNKADGKALPFEIERWDTEAQMAEIWVKLDTIKANDSTQYFLMYWGDGEFEGASSGPAVFDASSGFRMVYHMDSVAQNSSDAARKNVYRNSVQDVFHGEDYTSSPSMEGTVGEGRNFQENNDYINLGVPSIKGDALTLSMWIKVNYLDNADRPLVSKATGKYAESQWWKISLFENGKLKFHLKTNEKTATAHSKTNIISMNTWTFVTARYDGSAMRLFKYDGAPSDGEVGNESKSGDLSTSSLAEAWVGNNPGSEKRAFNGYIDEVRISAAARSAAWLKLCFESQKQGSQFLRMED